jgi:hypothetical protein
MDKNGKNLNQNKTENKFKKWMNLQNLVFIVVIAIFLVTIVWSGPISHLFSGISLQDVKATVTPTQVPGEPTPLPAEYYATSNQTNGIIVGAVVIVTIVIAGTIGILVRDKA